MGVAVLVSLCVVPFLGRDFFPAVDAGQFRLHVRAPVGSRIEATEERFYDVGRAIREVIPPNEIKTVLDNIGLPVSGINLAFSDNATVSSADGEILISLAPKHKPVAHYMRILREKLHRDFPDMDFFFSAPDIVSQILNFGIPSPIDVPSFVTIQVPSDTPAVIRLGSIDWAVEVSDIPSASTNPWP